MGVTAKQQETQNMTVEKLYDIVRDQGVLRGFQVELSTDTSCLHSGDRLRRMEDDNQRLAEYVQQCMDEVSRSMQPRQPVSSSVLSLFDKWV